MRLWKKSYSEWKEELEKVQEEINNRQVLLANWKPIMKRDPELREDKIRRTLIEREQTIKEILNYLETKKPTWTFEVIMTVLVLSFIFLWLSRR